MVARLYGGLGELLHDERRRRNVRVPEAEVNHVASLRAKAALQRVDRGEDVRRKLVDAAELHGVEYSRA